MMNDSQNHPDPLSGGEKELLRSLRLLGELAPEAADEVDSAESVWDDVSEEELPESLRDAVALAASISSQTSTIVDASFEANEADSHVELEMARVARLGNQISDEVERTMEKDRAHAREQSKNR